MVDHRVACLFLMPRSNSEPLVSCVLCLQQFTSLRDPTQAWTACVIYES